MEREQVHGTYWVPIGIPCGAAVAAGLLGGRALGTVVAGERLCWESLDGARLAAALVHQLDSDP